MKLLSCISFLTLIAYISAVPQPDTNIQIQHYDGPVYLGTPPPNCCPFCNSILKPEGKECETPEICPQVYGNTYDNEPYGITVSLDAKDQCENDKTALGKINLGAQNCKSMLHTSIPNIPVTYKYGTGIENTWSPYGASPLSNYLPINTACQNTCQVPILAYGNSGTSNNEEPVLVPQKFMYSLILDGEVGKNQNGCDSRLYYY
ncbi:uncharacterized protein LOC134751501 [Cydia strobilella]|uniref:uncharacterized protein LOC134751501 n=1 Tax=Cydia strobilella TaxID=1100964 RepID=UPI003006C38E